MILEARNRVTARRQGMAWLDRCKTMAEETARGLAVELLKQMVYNSPQWTGDFASNWRFSVGSADLTYDTGDVAPPSGPTTEPWKQFSRPAVQLGMAKNRGKEFAFVLGQDIFISNASQHDTVYAGGVFDGSVKLREVNRNVALSEVLMNYNTTYGRPLTQGQVRSLRSRRI